MNISGHKSLTSSLITFWVSKSRIIESKGEHMKALKINYQIHIQKCCFNWHSHPHVLSSCLKIFNNLICTPNGTSSTGIDLFLCGFFPPFQCWERLCSFNQWWKNNHLHIIVFRGFIILHWTPQSMRNWRMWQEGSALQWSPLPAPHCIPREGSVPLLFCPDPTTSRCPKPWPLFPLPSALLPSHLKLSFWSAPSPSSFMEASLLWQTWVFSAARLTWASP